MRFLVDAQLPPALARFLTDAGYEASHVIDLSMERAPDAAIWDWAARHRAVVVTKDEDFATRVALSDSGPQIVWIRLGNTTRNTLLKAMREALPEVIGALERGERLVEMRQDRP